MKEAIAYNKKNHTARVVTAAEFKKLAAAAPGAARDYDLFSTVNVKPMNFRAAYHQGGHGKAISECFARAAGYGPRDHIFDRKAESETLYQALDQGKKVLLSLNGKLCGAAFNFANAEQCLPNRLWVQQNYNNYISVSVKTAEDVIKKMKQVKEHLRKTFSEEDLQKETESRIFALYQGAVRTYREFYVGQRKDDLKALYEDLLDKKGLQIGEERGLGFPVLLRLVPTKTTRRKTEPRIIHGNYDEETGVFSSLVFEDRNANRTRAYRDLEAEIMGNPDDGVYVLACPSVTLPSEDHEKTIDDEWTWKQIRFAIYDIAAQTKPARKPAREMGHNIAVSAPVPAPAR